jgi:hypothetical protein
MLYRMRNLSAGLIARSARLRHAHVFLEIVLIKSEFISKRERFDTIFDEHFRGFGHGIAFRLMQNRRFGFAVFQRQQLNKTTLYFAVETKFHRSDRSLFL